METAIKNRPGDKDEIGILKLINEPIKIDEYERSLDQVKGQI